MTQLTFFAENLPHLAAHLIPLWLNLPTEYRGPFFAHSYAAGAARKAGVDVTEGRPPRSNTPVVVASHQGYLAARPAPVVLVQHGVGQTYQGDPTNTVAMNHSAYSGGRDRERVVLYLCSSERDAKVNRAAYPQARSVAVGVPYLDKYINTRPATPDMVVWSSHADFHVCPETRWAMPHFESAIAGLKDAGINLIGHSHPRFVSHMKDFWRGHRVPFMQNYFDVLDQAALFISDNSSAIYEFAATGRPVIVLSPPWYRRHVNHGLRFWEALPGLHITEPEDLLSAIPLSLSDPPYLRDIRRRALDVAYTGCNSDGRATERAVTALVDLAESHPCP